ncbi:MAG: hypothetical protein DMF82_04875 [Acidobacteria bacterium]|nr:MAG: hypothetical protein DMF82_04875 [Acidobacteriota bacterium]
MRILHQTALAGALVTALAPAAAGRPNLDAPRPLGSLTLYSDDQRPGLFFYGPGELAVVRGGDGRPDLHFIQMRYTGSVVTADRGRILQRSLLSFRVAMQAPSAADLQAARRSLAPGPAPIEFRPLPIQRLEAALVYAPVGRAEEASLPPGHFEEGEADASKAPGTFWTSRSYMLGLDPETSELFGGALAKGQVVLSMSYSFYAVGAGSEPSKPRVVRAGAFAISVDAARWPDFLRRVDINERVPPGYPLLDVYCYDFRDALRPALYEKQVEVEAEGVGGRAVVAGARFGRDQPDLYARSVRFGVGVRLDRPYRYRVTETADDGTSAIGAWQARESWTDLLDVTARPGGER